MRFRDVSVTPIRVGLDQVGIAGLAEALKATDDLGADDFAAVTSRMLEILAARNHVPESRREAYRVAFWREFRRHRGRDFSAWYSEIPATVRGAPGASRDRFARRVEDALASYELKPILTLVDDTAGPELLIDDEVVASGAQTRVGLEQALRRTFSHW